jgi:superoxide dismutase, Cu-Zn family
VHRQRGSVRTCEHGGLDVTKSAHLVSWLASLSLAVSACGGAPAPSSAAPPEAAQPEAAQPSPAELPPGAAAEPAAPAAEAKTGGGAAPVTLEVPIEARSNSKLKGTATFTEVDGGVKVVVQVSGAPAGRIATHIHEIGDCSAPDAKSAGEHFNPEKHPHGLPDGAPRHLGDLGNIEVNANGTGTHEITVKGANLKPNDPHSYIGRAIIVHAKQDDGSQPAGNAGGRIGCGVISAQRP